MGQFRTAAGKRLEVLRAVGVAESHTDLEKAFILDFNGVHADEVGMCFNVTEGTGHVVVARVYLFTRVGNTEVPNMFVALHGGERKHDVRFVVFVCHIVNSDTPRKWAEGAVEDGTSFLTLVANVNDAEGGSLAMRSEEKKILLDGEAVAFANVLCKTLGSEGFVFVRRRMVAVIVVGPKVTFRLIRVDKGRSAETENAIEVVPDGRREDRPERREDVVGVAVSPDILAADVANNAGNVEVIMK